MADYQLISGASIDAAAAQIESYLTSQRVDRPTILRIRITAENALLKYAETFGQSARFRLTCEKRFGRLRVAIAVPGAPLDPFEDGEETEYVRRMMQTMSAAPVWTHRRSVNHLVFSPDARRKIPEIVRILAAAAGGVGFGALAGLLPEGARNTVCDQWLSPVSSAIMGLISALAVGIVFLSIADGVSGMGDLDTFKKIGRRLIARILLFLSVDAVFITSVMLLVTPFRGGGGGEFEAATLWQTLLGIVPANLVEPFLTGNSMQVIFLALCAGAALLISGNRGKTLTVWIGQANQLLLLILRGVIRLMPVVVFLSFFTLKVQGKLGILSRVWKYPVFAVAVAAVYLTVMILFTVVKTRVSPRLLVRKMLPTFLVAASTASSSAAYAVNVETCEKKLGVDSRLTGFGVPLGQTMFKLCGVAESIAGCLCVAELYGVPIGLPKLISLMISAVVLAVSQPSVPGVMFSTFTLLFAQLGIPVEGISVILPIVPLADHLMTPINVAALQMLLVQIASSAKMLDTEKLRKE